MEAETATRRWRDVSEYVATLGLDAYLVGGAVRDELLRRTTAKDQDFVVPNVGHAELRRALEPHGRVEDLEVAGQLVGVRLYPRDGAARALAPAGIEFAPPRTERSTGPGRHDFEIVADASIPLEADMERRDFTVNAIAKRLATGEILDPLGGTEDLRRGVLRTVSPQSFLEDPLRIVRGLRFVSELGFEPDEATVAQMREHAPQVRLVSGERIGGGLAADGMGELSKLLLGAQPARALRLARDTGALVQVIPAYAEAIGFEDQWQPLPLEEHIFTVVQAAADAGAPLRVRLAALLHDLGKPAARGDIDAHARIGAEIARAALRRLRYPTQLVADVTRIVRHHAFRLDRDVEPLDARRFLREHGEQLAVDLVAHKQADLTGRERADDERRLERLRELLEVERSSPHRLADLAIDGGDLIDLGFAEGPAIGRALDTLLDEVVEDPARNTREWLTERARRLLT